MVETGEDFTPSRIASIFIWFFSDERNNGIAQWADSVRYVSPA